VLCTLQYSSVHEISRTVSCISVKRFMEYTPQSVAQKLAIIIAHFSCNAEEGHAATYVVLSTPSDLVTMEQWSNVQYVITIKTFYTNISYCAMDTVCCTVSYFGLIHHSFHWHVQNATIPCRSQ
jgi:hypothetical protein